MIQVFAVTLLFSTAIYLAMALAMAHHSRRQKCNCKTAAMIMAGAARKKCGGTDAANGLLPILPY